MNTENLTVHEAVANADEFILGKSVLFLSGGLMKTSEVIEKAIIDISDEWYHKPSEEKHSAIMRREWVEFEVAMCVRSLNYTLVPVDFYERIGKAVDENKGVKWILRLKNIKNLLQKQFLILSLKLCSILPWDYREKVVR